MACGAFIALPGLILSVILKGTYVFFPHFVLPLLELSAWYCIIFWNWCHALISGTEIHPREPNWRFSLKPSLHQVVVDKALILVALLLR